MAYDAYLKIEGVKGDSTRDGFKESIEIYSFSLGAGNPASISTAGTGAATGKVSISEINVMKKADSASGPLFDACCAGNHFKSGSLTLNKSGGAASVAFMKFDLTEVFVNAIQWSGSSGGDDTPTESVSLAFATINITYTPQNADGTSGTAIINGWDIRTNKKL